MRNLAIRWSPLAGLLLLCLMADLGYLPWRVVPLSIAGFTFGVAVTSIYLRLRYGEW